MEEVLTKFHRKIAALSAEMRTMSANLDELYFIIVELKNKLMLLDDKEAEEE